MPVKLPPGTLEKAVELQGKLWTHNRIAKELGVHRMSVQRMLARHDKRTYERLASRHAAIRAKQAQQHEHMAAEAYEGWERSKLDSETVKVVTESGSEADEGKVIRTERMTKTQPGNPSFLAEVRAQLAEVRRVLEMDAAKDETAVTASSPATTQAMAELMELQKAIDLEVACE